MRGKGSNVKDEKSISKKSPILKESDIEKESTISEKVDNIKNEVEKRKSYRAKAKDYNKIKAKRGISKSLKSSTKISTKNQNIKLLEKQEKVENRLGWWNH